MSVRTALGEGGYPSGEVVSQRTTPRVVRLRRYAETASQTIQRRGGTLPNERSEDIMPPRHGLRHTSFRSERGLQSRPNSHPKPTSTHPRIQKMANHSQDEPVRTYGLCKATLYVICTPVPSSSELVLDEN